jgi:hypothetical protein
MINLIPSISKTVSPVDFIQGREGKYRVIVKVRAGFFSVVEEEHYTDPIAVIESYNKWKGAIQTMEFKAEGSNRWLTVLARKGKNVVVLDQEIMSKLRVGHINRHFFRTNLYDQFQYSLVGAKNWSHFAFVPNN